MISNYVDLDDIKVHYLSGGKGKVLILLPSLWVTSASYEKIGTKLSRYYRLIIPDIYKGKSLFKKPADSLDQYSDTLNAFITKLGIADYYLIGISTSGLIADEYVRNFPKSVNKLILVSSSATNMNVKRDITWLLTGYAKLFVNCLKSWTGIKAYLMWTIDSLGYFLRHPYQHLNEPFKITFPVTGEISVCPVPTKLLFALKDEYLSLEVLDWNRKIKNLEIETINDNHTWFFRKQGEFIEKVRKYFPEK